MIEQARQRQGLLGLVNLTWIQGDAEPLPLSDGLFSRVITRYAFHHFIDPKGVFAEMVGFVRPAGRITVCDVFADTAEQAELYDRLEKFRDRSHTMRCNSLNYSNYSPGSERYGRSSTATR